ncbi:hypothetical protein ACJJTC_011551 [Scirpophaga incertulas]
MGSKNKNHGRKNKINLVFDEEKRKEFLCGFRKRKLERQKKAKEELQKKLKEEKKRIKIENRESYKKLVVSSRPIPDIEKLLQDEYEDDDVNVKIVELSSDTLQKNDLVLGVNKCKEFSVKKDAVPKKPTTKLLSSIPGMSSDVDSDRTESETEEKHENNLKTKKEIKQILKKQATKKMQKSKVFQMKSKMDRMKNKKKSQQKKMHINGKLQSKRNKSIKKLGKRKQKH